MKRLIASLAAEIAAAWRRRFTRVMLLWVPLLVGLLIGFIFVKQRVPQKLPIAVCALDSSRLIRELLADMESNQGFTIHARVPDLASGRHLLASGQVRGLLLIPREFTRRIRRLEQAQLVLYEDFNFPLPGRTLMRNMVKIENWLQGKLRRERFERRGVSRQAAAFFSDPLQINYKKLYNPSLEYTQYLLPGVLFAILFQSLVVVGGVMLADDTAVPASPSWFAFAARRLTAYLFLSLLPLAIVYGLLFSLFQLLQGNPLLMVPLYLLFAMAALLLGVFVYLLVGDAIMATEIMIMVGAAGFTFSGFTWPRQMFIPLLREAVYLLPFTSLMEESTKIWYHVPGGINPLPLLLLNAFLIVLSGLARHIRHAPRRTTGEK